MIDIQACYQQLSQTNKTLLAAHLMGMNQGGFSYTIKASFFEYLDSRQGKDFKYYVSKN